MSPRPEASFQPKPEFQADVPDDRDASLRSHDGKEAEAGFTLVELMVVIVILGLLTTLVVINVMPSQDLAMRKKAEADIATIGQALEMYRVSNMTYPTSAQGLAVLAGQSGTIRRLPDDPWGRPYQYANPGPNGGVDVYSLGADGQPGGKGENADIRLAN